MLKLRIKNFFKKSFLFYLGVFLIFLYLKIVYLTTRWKFIWPEGYSKEDLKKEEGILFAIWHCNLAYAIKIFGEYRPVKALASPHSDGRIIGEIVRLWGHGVIEGSSFKNPSKALREIISSLNKGENIVVTPDGPKGPAREINSTIVKIAHKYNKKLVAVACFDVNGFILNSWDRMVIPKPFGRVSVKISRPLELTGDEVRDNLLLQEFLSY